MLAYGSATTRWDGYMGPFFLFSSLVFCFGDEKARSRQAMIRITALEAQTDAMILLLSDAMGFSGSSPQEGSYGVFIVQLSTKGM